jgi:hypothetical protein
MELAPFNPVSKIVGHVLVDDHTAGDVVIAKFAEGPKLTYPTLLVIFVKVLAVAER